MKLAIFTKDGQAYRFYASVQEFLDIWTGYTVDDISTVVYVW